MTTKRNIIFLLANLNYPATPLTAAIEWEITVNRARPRLLSAKEQGYLFKVGHSYSPTPELLQAWVAEGVLI